MATLHDDLKTLTRDLALERHRLTLLMPKPLGNGIAAASSNKASAPPTPIQPHLIDTATHVDNIIASVASMVTESLEHELPPIPLPPVDPCRPWLPNLKHINHHGHALPLTLAQIAHTDLTTALDACRRITKSNLNPGQNTTPPLVAVCPTCGSNSLWLHPDYGSRCITCNQQNLTTAA